MNGRVYLGLLVAALFTATATAHAQIYRWNNGQVIPGTEGITPGPGVLLGSWDSEWNSPTRNLRMANFSGLDLQSAFFASSWLDDAHFINTNLRDASLYGASLTGADFSGAIVAGAGFGGSITKQQLYATASYKSKQLPGVVVYGMDLSGADLSGQVLTGADLRADLTGANLREAVLVSVVFGTGYKLNGNLADANLDGAVVNGAMFSRAGLTKEQLYSTASYRAKDLRGVGLWGEDLTGWDLSGQDLTGARFSVPCEDCFGQTKLSGVDFSDAIIAGVDFSASIPDYQITSLQLYSTASYQSKNLQGTGFALDDLTSWDFSGQNLTNANFYHSMLTNANLTGVKLVNADLTRANLTGADLRGAEGWNRLGDPMVRNTILPDGRISGLTLAAYEQLFIRDYDGGPGQALPPNIFVADSFSVSDRGLLHCVLESDFWNSMIHFQPGIPVELGGTLEHNFTDDTQLATQSGRAIKAFDWTGVTPQGTFTVQGQPGTAWDTSNLYTTGEVTLLGISSDLNGDKDVDSEDLLGFLENWTGSAYPAADKTWQDGDSDKDGDVDSADMLVFLSQWTGPAADAGVDSVPEPATLSLAGLIGTMLAAARCRGARARCAN